MECEVKRRVIVDSYVEVPFTEVGKTRNGIGIKETCFCYVLFEVPILHF